MARKPKPAPEAIEAQADALLEEDAARLEEMYREAVLPRNDPEYLAKLEARSEQVDQVGNKVDVVHIVEQRGRTKIELGMTNPRDLAGTLEAARTLGQLLEARVIRLDDPSAIKAGSDWTEARQPRHAFGREKRSLPR